jgi:hypothetical protein
VSGHRHAARPARHHGGLLAAGSVAVLVAVVIGGAAWVSGVGRGDHHTLRARGAEAVSSPMNSLHGAERDAVPGACDTLSASLAKQLAPGADRSETVATQSDQHSECAWSLFAANRSRQLNVELRAIGADGGTSATDGAIRTFNDEWHTDRLGKDLADGAKVHDSRGVTGVGEQAYIVYTVDGAIGAAVANTRLANILVTVHYSGGDHLETHGKPMSSGSAGDGALQAARDIISKLESHS